MSQPHDSDCGLRAPKFLEAQSADKQVHSVIAESVSQRQWSLGQVLHELTAIRVDLPLPLQPSPRPIKPSIPSNASKGSQKGSWKGKQNNSKGRGKGKQKGGRVEWMTEGSVGGQKRQLCMRFQTGHCQLGDSCRFHHACACPKDGKACRGSHSAKDHRTDRCRWIQFHRLCMSNFLHIQFHLQWPTNISLWFSLLPFWDIQTVHQQRNQYRIQFKHWHQTCLYLQTCLPPIHQQIWIRWQDAHRPVFFLNYAQDRIDHCPKHCCI